MTKKTTHLEITGVGLGGKRRRRRLGGAPVQALVLSANGVEDEPSALVDADRRRRQRVVAGGGAPAAPPLRRPLAAAGGAALERQPLADARLPTLRPSFVPNKTTKETRLNVSNVSTKSTWTHQSHEKDHNLHQKPNQNNIQINTKIGYMANSIESTLIR